MLVNVIYEDSGRIDVIDLPDSMVPQLDAIQEEFFRWMFNPNTNHPYWVFIDGKKAYCSYDVTAFLNWANSHYSKGNEQMRLITRDRGTPLEHAPHLIF